MSHMLIAAALLLSSFARAGVSQQEQLPPNAQIGNYAGVDVFKKGHRIAVQVQSTWFPLIDRNPQTFQASIFNASGADFKAQTHSVYHNRKYPSAIRVDVPTVSAPTP